MSKIPENFKFANRVGWSDVEPFEIIRVISDKTIEIRQMNSVKSEGWNPEFVQGGFSAICTNNSEQQWDITPDETMPIIRARLHKDGKWRSKHGDVYRLSEKAIKIYDYNF